jgi:hypothetical protein
MKFCTYISRHRESGWFYIGKGQTSKVLKGYKGSGKALVKAFKKYPKDTWVCSILQTYETEHEAYEAEALLVTAEVMAQPKCLNLQLGGREVWKDGPQRKGLSSTKGTKLTEEHKKLLSEATKRYWSKPGLREVVSQRLKGHKKPDGFGDKISAASKSRWSDPAFREKMCERMKQVWALRRGEQG